MQHGKRSMAVSRSLLSYANLKYRSAYFKLLLTDGKMAVNVTNLRCDASYCSALNLVLLVRNVVLHHSRFSRLFPLPHQGALLGTD